MSLEQAAREALLTMKEVRQGKAVITFLDIDKLEEALAQQDKPDPTGWRWPWVYTQPKGVRLQSTTKREWVGLTAKDIGEVFRKAEMRMTKKIMAWQIAIIEETNDKLKELNT